MKTLLPSVTITLDRDRKMYYDINANIAYEELVGESLIETMQSISEAARKAEGTGKPAIPPTKIIRALLWAALRGETLDNEGNETASTLSLHQVGTLLDYGSLLETLKLIGEA